MTKQIQPGINVTTISTKKFKTIRILIRFTARHTAKAASARTLLTSLLETNSLHFPTQTALSKELAALYGASFGINVAKKGNTHQVNVAMNVVNGEYVGDKQVFIQALSFLQEILFSPNQQNGQFDTQTFTLEKENLMAYLASIEEDKQMWASLQLQELFFEQDQDQKVPSFGTISGVKACTAESVVKTYESMMNEDQIDMFVVGDISAAEVEAGFATWDWPKTSRVHPEIITDFQTSNIIREKQVTEPVSQAKLNIAYHLDVTYDSTLRFPAMVFNGLFGGFSHSKLFLNVREKESLAYYASSNLDLFRGMVTVQTGIDSTNRNRVLQLIHEQLEALKTGDITELELQQTKERIKTQYYLGQDYAQNLIEKAYYEQWLPKTKKTEEQWLQALAAVTKESIQQVAQRLSLQAIFFLEGEDEHGEA
ncbi:EF-P 5-aminopentanol modification-associated protein YfmF [Enterococcus italicus]|uniref:EF-P 5-aminopentanol modification-associated protein YfmF n=1 Tax=Enterococcus italicus TaxID=246144 RepID=UPI0028AA5050|nr:pitrilysin family protein [Enterococcus italicus]